MFIKPQITQCSLTISEQDIHFMRYALELADRAEAIGEIPVGAVLVDQEGNIIGEGWNQVIQLSDPSAHAEMLAIRQAGKVQRNYRLLDCTLYVTLEPCTMCAGAILHSRLRRLVFGASDYKTGAIGSRFHLFEDYKMNHFLEIRGCVLAEECSQKISRFFQRRRQEQKRQKQAV
ncbi:tRNA adenosine(34) deaminase TadA [Actinobacillus pleuropneumoniae]|nr:tRNA adenosine(34) deaminase TadA [Actinobacillus pleuropneumoniae]MCL7720591.1 tRNA adenosine(34) deaminase TadA [Actinobacillus pleuropneumoniae]MCL7727303.1 tRNA adenosine(34) deaminase TadA [Actinobacillus pleuropneumoniae]MCL7730011.1 tRNA adenosine(34) deaminase TadA [Actinobacillus pleuropneumoniae]MCY6367508.1 tRNA adenosine(34) deaminase TadA [Actinobacillus pleuropneumoniae]MCY6384375.1 tRNA adenosine(34) deaminase TadA [Actinobacillus pleuropneumoniae]